ncbi:MAG: hypothetical protein ABIH99_05660 [Candidatus Micrarchaeota archaeon]
MKKCARGQISVEVMVILGFAIVFLIPVVFVAYSQSNSFNEQLAITQAEASAKRIAEAVNSVGAMGAGGISTVDIIVPPETESILITGREVVFKVRSRGEITEVVKTTDYKMIGTLAALSSGATHSIRVTALADSVNVEKAN